MLLFAWLFTSPNGRNDTPASNKTNVYLFFAPSLVHMWDMSSEQDEHHLLQHVSVVAGVNYGSLRAIFCVYVIVLCLPQKKKLFLGCTGNVIRLAKINK